MGVVGEQVHHGNARRRRQALELGVVEDSSGDHGVVPGEHAGNVLGCLPRVDARLLTEDRHRVAAQLNDRQLHRAPGP